MCHFVSRVYVCVYACVLCQLSEHGHLLWRMSNFDIIGLSVLKGWHLVAPSFQAAACLLYYWGFGYIGQSFLFSSVWWHEHLKDNKLQNLKKNVFLVVWLLFLMFPLIFLTLLVEHRLNLVFYFSPKSTIIIGIFKLVNFIEWPLCVFFFFFTLVILFTGCK